MRYGIHTAAHDELAAMTAQRDKLAEALREMLAIFGEPHKEEYVDGGASYELACKTVRPVKYSQSAA